MRETAIAFDWCDESHKSFIAGETERIMQRKRTKEGEHIKQDWIAKVCDRAANKGLQQTADELIMTYRIAQAYKLAGKVAGESEHEEQV